MMPFNTLIPNMITVMALCSGMTGIRFAIEGRWEFAAGAIAVSAVLDALDGSMARLLKGASKFGAELDSLSDFIAFGVAPATIMFLWTTKDVGGFGWMACLFYATCMALRLARFNTKLDDPDKPAFAHRFFTGTPAPAAAGIGLLPLLLSFELPWSWLSNPIFISTWMVLAGLLMVSQLPTFAFKGLRVKQRYVLPTLITAGLIIASLVSVPWQSLAGIVLIYIVSMPFSIRMFARLTDQAEAAKAAEQKGEPKIEQKAEPTEEDA